jgi:hypothetical protein
MPTASASRPGGRCTRYQLSIEEIAHGWMPHSDSQPDCCSSLRLFEFAVAGSAPVLHLGHTTPSTCQAVGRRCVGRMRMHLTMTVLLSHSHLSPSYCRLQGIRGLQLPTRGKWGGVSGSGCWLLDSRPTNPSVDTGCHWPPRGADPKMHDTKPRFDRPFSIQLLETAQWHCRSTDSISSLQAPSQPPTHHVPYMSIRGDTCSAFLTRCSLCGRNTNVTRSFHGVFVTSAIHLNKCCCCCLGPFAASPCCRRAS